nr:2-C-methyl-D-erythritol 4-phosphate cytidylyltransferase [Symbiobacterium terraclitae]
MGGGTAKQFLPLRGEPVLVRTVGLFSRCPLVDEIVIAAGNLETTRQLVGHLPKVARIVPGGQTRQESVWAALQAVHSRPRIVAVHDAARPLLTPEVLEGVLCAAALHPALVVAVPVQDTIKQVDDEGRVVATPDRRALWAAQTPQVFWADVLVRAFRQAMADGFSGTDDASLVERTGVPVRVFRGEPGNIKLTTPADFRAAEAALEGGA